MKPTSSSASGYSGGVNDLDAASQSILGNRGYYDQKGKGGHGKGKGGGARSGPFGLDEGPLYRADSKGSNKGGGGKNSNTGKGGKAGGGGWQKGKGYK